MSDKTGIEWTDATWNPLRGCTRVSEGCRNCYAEGVAARFSGSGQPYEGLAAYVGADRLPRWTGGVALVEHTLDQPLRWKKPRRIFVNSMSDLFHESVPDGWIDRIFAVMALSPQHTFQVLTKRPERMRDYLCPYDQRRADALGKLVLSLGHDAPLELLRWPLPNVWLGVSVEDQSTADERIPLLLDTPAAKRFVSAEPLLGPLDLYNGDPDPRLGGHEATHTFLGEWWELDDNPKVPPRSGVDWVIVGGESGPNARPMHPDWVRSLRDQCATVGVPFFFKQWGEWAPHKVTAGGDLGGDVRSGRVTIVHPSGREGHEIMAETGNRQTEPGSRYMARVGKKAAGALLDGREHREFPA